MQQPDSVNDNRRSVGGGLHRSFFDLVISPHNLFAAWKRFSEGKKSHRDVAAFALRLEDNLFLLHERLARGAWVSDPYEPKPVADPKPRLIHIPSVRDRVLFQAVYQQLYQVFDKTFIHDSCASRIGKGTHAGVRRFAFFARKASANYAKQAFVLKCDVRKFFDGIDHAILFRLLLRRVTDEKLLGLLRDIVGSFSIPHVQHWIPASAGMTERTGLPLGNVTSQLFANIYLNEFDQFVKHVLKERFYIRYCDDFVILHESRRTLDMLVEQIRDFVRQTLLLELHPNKVSIRKLRQGMDFLGYVSLPHYAVLRTRTKRRMLRRLSALAQTITSKKEFESALPIIQSYRGMLSHCKREKLRREIEQLFEKWR